MACIERAKCVLVVCGDEHDRRRELVRLERFQQREAIDLRHLDIDEQHVGTFSAECVARGAAIGARCDDVDSDCHEIGREALTRVQLVVDDDGA